MAETVLDLISEAYYLSGIVADTSAPTGAQVSRGLKMLNGLAALKSSNARLIPFSTIYNLTVVVGQEAYFIPNLIDADTVTYNLNTNLRTPLKKVSRAEYFGAARINGLTTLPGMFYVERVKGGANLYLYPFPNFTYPVQIVGKFSLNNVSLMTDLTTIYDGDYIQYLIFALARYICIRRTVSFPPQAAAELKAIEKQLFDRSPLDLTYAGGNLFNRGYGINYGIANLSNGWLP